MAKVKAPFLSLGASGKIAGTLVASSWKGLKTVREYVKPSNPRTAAQTTQRNLFSSAVAAFRNFLTNTTGRAAWNRSALATGNAQSGFNVAVKSLVGILGTDPDASFANVAAAGSGQTVDFTMLNMDDGTTGDESGSFEVWAGDAPGSLLLNANDVEITAGTLSTGDLGDEGDVKYVKIRKDSFDRSGIFKITLTA
jgi:hypothetical protein